MEKVQETPDTPEVFQNDIELYLSQFCEEHNIEDMTKEPQSRWNAALMYINKYVFSDKSILKLNKNINKNNTNCIMDSNFYMYDLDKLEYILYIYYYLCSVYDKECSIMGYSLLTGINYDTLMDWGADERKLSTKGFDIVQKLRIFREESLSNKLATGNKNPVGILAILNRHYAWNLPGVSRAPQRSLKQPQTFRSSDHLEMLKALMFVKLHNKKSLCKMYKKSHKASK